MPNESLIHADIFFFIATIALVLISAGIVTASIYVIGILKNVRDMTDKARDEWDEIIADSQRLRGALRDEGMKWKHVVDLVRNFFVRGGEKKAEQEAVKAVRPGKPKIIKHAPKQKPEQKSEQSE